jgi:hypothetical protein
VELRREHDVVAPPAGQRLADDLLRLAARVDVGRVDEVDPGVERAVDDPHARVVVGLAPRAEHHGAEAQRADVHAGARERSLLHAPTVPGARAREVCNHRPPMPRHLRGTLVAVLALLAAAAPAGAQLGEYSACPAAGDAMFVEVSRASCADAQAVAIALTAVPATSTEAALAATGWTPLRVAANDFQESYDTVATRGLAALRIRRRGPAPDLDGWMANRELVFSSAKLVPGAPAPSGSTLCTSSFLIRLGTRLGGLSAAHCAGVTKTGVTRRRNAALRRPPQPGIVLGSVRRNLARRAKTLDALVLPVPQGAGRPAAAVVERFIWRPPWFVRGTAKPLLGRRVCYAGVTSGPDNCGKIVHAYPGTRGLSCTSITAREGDSGAPVYTYPAADGTVRAVGIANIVFGLLQSMCFVPIEPVLDALAARLVTSAG